MDKNSNSFSVNTIPSCYYWTYYFPPFLPQFWKIYKQKTLTKTTSTTKSLLTSICFLLKKNRCWNQVFFSFNPLFIKNVQQSWTDGNGFFASWFKDFLIQHIIQSLYWGNFTEILVITSSIPYELLLIKSWDWRYPIHYFLYVCTSILLDSSKKFCFSFS